MIDPFAISIDFSPFDSAVSRLAAIAGRNPQAVDAFLEAFPIEQLSDCTSAPDAAVLTIRPSEILNNFIGLFDLSEEMV